MQHLQTLPLVLVPCLSGAPWDLRDFPAWAGRTVRTGALPDLDGIEAYADHVAGWTAGLESFALVGDSFGASVALALAARRPRGLRALVLSGGFARPYVSAWTRAKAALGRALPYRALVAVHVASLGSRFDPSGTRAELERTFLRHTPRRAFFRRVATVLSTDLRGALPRVEVPTLVLTPEDDQLIGRAAARELVDGIAGAQERVLAGTGHLLRFTHEGDYAAAVDAFLAARLPLGVETGGGSSAVRGGLAA